MVSLRRAVALAHDVGEHEVKPLVELAQLDVGNVALVVLDQVPFPEPSHGNPDVTYGDH